jgi:VCBS repeat-containing protein
MVAAMPLITVSHTDKKPVTSTDLRNIAIGLAAAIALIILAGQMADSGSASVSALEDTVDARFGSPTVISTPTTSATEDVAYDSDSTWVDTDGAITFTCTGCADWMTFTNNADGGAGTASTYTIAGTPDDSEVGATAITVNAAQGGTTVQGAYTITVSNANDAPTLTVTAATSTFTEDGSASDLYSSVTTGDGDSTVTDTFTSIILTVTNVADTTEYLNVNSGACDLTHGNSETTTIGTDLTCAVSVAAGTATVTLSHAGLTAAQVNTLIDGISYENSDDSPTTGDRVITITSLVDDGGGSDTLTPSSAAATITVASAEDDPVIANSDNTGAVTEDSGTTTAGDTLVGSDADGDSLSWSCTSCADDGDTQSLTGTYGAWTLTEATGVWLYTISNVDTDTDALDAGDQPTDALTVILSDGAGTTDSITVTVTLTGANDAPTTSTPTTQVGAEDTTFTGFVTADFPFSDVDDSDTALTSITITVLESTGALTRSLDGVSYNDVAANDVILEDDIQHLKLAPVADAVADITFTYTVQDAAASSGTAVMTVSFANSNDDPTVANAQADQAVNEDATLDYDIPSNTFTDADSADSCTYTSTQTDGSALPSWLTFTTSTRNYGGTPLNANVGTLSVRSTCSDGHGGSVNDDFDIVISNTNDVPTSTSFTVTTAEDTEHVFTAAEFGYADVDSGDALVSAVLQAATAGTLWIDDGGGAGTPDDGIVNGNEAAVANNDVVSAAELAKLSWDPAANANGASYATFTYTLYDGDGYSTSYTATLTVTAVNDPPTSAANSVAGTEDTLHTYAAADFSFTDTEGSSIAAIKITTLESAGTLECYDVSSSGVWADCVANDIVSAGTSIRLTPAADSVADVTFSFKVSDGTDYSAAAYVLTTTHAAVNDAPAIANPTTTIAEDATKTFSATAGTAATEWG